MGDMPRSEYPRPSFVRERWLCLNGEWDFEIDKSDSGEARGLVNAALPQKITVPFCPESELSGIGETDFLNAVWYRRVVDVPSEWEGSRVLLHFQACDDETTVWIDGQRAGWHRGGWTPFSIDLGKVAGQSLTIVVRARDDHRDPKPRGKQSSRHENYGCYYTRTTGIWQTVWMEPVPAVSLQRSRVTPNVGRSVFAVEQPLDLGDPRGSTKGWTLRATLKQDGAVVTQAAISIADLTPTLLLAIPGANVRLWSIDDPFLYDIEIELMDASGEVVDRATTYAGLRSVAIDGCAITLNGKPVFQRLVLDQGYYPDGIMTAPTEQALIDDITLSQEAGFNGARLHQKVFEERFLYHADRLGYLVWGEFGDWGLQQGYRLEDMIHGWTEAVVRDVSHPSIVGWCPLNEQRHYTDPDNDRMATLMRTLVAVTKAIDPTRPVLDVSGGYHCADQSDVLDTHDYDQNAATMLERCNSVIERGEGYWASPKFPAPPLRGRPFFVSEFGGIWWNPEAAEGEASWGYGERPKTVEEFYERFEAMCRVLLEHPKMFGYCYTQLTDVFQEQNGIYHFDRSTKFDMERIRAAQTQVAAIEKRG